MSTLILIASMLGLAFGALYTLFKPRWAILFIIVLYPLEQLLTTVSGFFSSNLKALNLLVGGLAIVGVGSAFVSGRAPFRGFLNATWFMTIVLYMWVAMGIAYSPDRANAMLEFQLGLPYLGLLLVFPGLLINNLQEFRRLLLPTLVIGTLIIVFLLGSPKASVWGGRLVIEGAAGSDKDFQNPLATASLGGMVVIIGMLYKPHGTAVLVNMIRVGAIVSGLAIMFLSGSRGQLLAAIGTSLLMFPFARQIKNIKQFLTVGAAGFVAVLLGFVVLKLVSTGDSASRWESDTLGGGIDSRVEYITGILEAYLSRPFVYLQGLGTSSFDTYWQGSAPYVHNMPVQALTEHGLIGATLVVVIMLLTARAGWGLLRLYKDDPEPLAAVAILNAICLYNFILTLKQGNFATSATPFWWFLILAKINSRTFLEAKAYWAWESQAQEYQDLAAPDAA